MVFYFYFLKNLFLFFEKFILSATCLSNLLLTVHTYLHLRTYTYLLLFCIISFFHSAFIVVQRNFEFLFAASSSFILYVLPILLCYFLLTVLFFFFFFFFLVPKPNMFSRITRPDVEVSFEFSCLFSHFCHSRRGQCYHSSGVSDVIVPGIYTFMTLLIQS